MWQTFGLQSSPLDIDFTAQSANWHPGATQKWISLCTCAVGYRSDIWYAGLYHLYRETEFHLWHHRHYTQVAQILCLWQKPGHNHKWGACRGFQVAIWSPTGICAWSSIVFHVHPLVTSWNNGVCTITSMLMTLNCTTCSVQESATDKVHILERAAVLLSPGCCTTDWNWMTASVAGCSIRLNDNIKTRWDLRSTSERSI